MRLATAMPTVRPTRRDATLQSRPAEKTSCAILGLLLGSLATGAAADPSLRIVEQASFPANDGSYGLTVRGSSIPDGTRIFRDDSRIVLEFADLRTMTACMKADSQPLPTGCDLPAVFHDGTEAAISGISTQLAGDNARLVGSHMLTVRIAVAPPMAALAGSASIAFSGVGQTVPRWSAAIASLALLGLVLLLLRGGGRRTLPNGTPIGLLQAAFLDSDTSTYSLSKLQFYIWSFAIVSGYLYLTFARSMVQGKLELADVPANLPLLMAISVGTTVAALGVATLAGSKGAGDFHPSASDFITSGGVVAPERLQHLLWSIIGSLGFLVFAFAISPSQIVELPALPDGFVQLMGLSATGYIAGKVARGAGPNIRSVMGQIDTGGGTITLTVDGANLDKTGSFLLTAPGGQDTPVVVQPDAALSVFDSSGKTATRLVFVGVPQPAGSSGAAAATPPATPAPLPPSGAAPTASPGAGLNGGSSAAAPPAARWRFTIVNADGEKAVWEFQPA